MDANQAEQKKEEVLAEVTAQPEQVTDQPTPTQTAKPTAVYILNSFLEREGIVLILPEIKFRKVDGGGYLIEHSGQLTVLYKEEVSTSK